MQSCCSGDLTNGSFVSIIVLLLVCRGVIPLDGMVVHCYKVHTMNRKVHSPLRRHLWPGGILAKKKSCGQILQIQKVSEFELSNSLTLIKTSFQYSRLETFKERGDGLLCTSPVYLFSNKTGLQNITA